ncbi:MAG: sulfur carrier protein ThiS adenylyltransferase ThiF [Candidatus Thermoplasmatota archaeon]|nr:sulfur carrier protein ThiS adenylyltransferase ThiF [Candidatus Thermoplasmatota archaeon]
MRVTVNEKEREVPEGSTLEDIRRTFKPHADVIVQNGFPCVSDFKVKGSDRIVLIKKGEIPPISELESMMMARNAPGAHERLKSSTVGIAGAGGLGSHVAISLARAGVGKLVLVDHDVVEPTNLNRQMYGIDHLGMKKVDALEHILLQANPFVEVEKHDLYLDDSNSPGIFRDCEVVVECLDDASAKSELISTVLSNLEHVRVVGASGLAGYGPANEIITKRHDRLYICGDGVSGIAPGIGLVSSRVMVCAGHQANQTIRVLLGEYD